MVSDAPTDPSRPKPPPHGHQGHRRPPPRIEATARLIPTGDHRGRLETTGGCVVNSQHPRTFLKPNRAFWPPVAMAPRWRVGADRPVS
jgi:hypothetical protein